MDIALFDLVYS